MAKKSKLIRNAKRQAEVKRQAPKREELRKRSVDIKLTLEERMEARAQLAQLPRDGSATRVRNRCLITGRPRAFSRRLGISRNMVRELAHQAVLPGCRKASW